jgi:hypothetical protein
MRLREAAADIITGGQYSAALSEAQAAAAESRETAARMDVATQALSEASRLVERAREDAAWTNLSTDQQSGADAIPRDKAVPLARWAFSGGDPFTKAAVWNKTNFAFGVGIDGPTGPDPDNNTALQILRAFWWERSNQSAMFSTLRQYERSNQLLIDGDLFLLLFVDAAGMVRVRRYDPLSVVSMVPDPDDPGRPLYYATKYQRRELNVKTGTMQQALGAKQEVRYYADFQNIERDADPWYDVVPHEDYNRDVYMLHVPLNRIRESSFGVSEVAGSVRWFLAAKRALEDLATISASTARLMNQISVAGTASDLTALASTIQDSISDATDELDEHGMSHAAMNLLPAGMEVKSERASSRANEAWQLDRMLRMRGAAGSGQALHYLADPENANLATSTSMELPVLRNFESYQALWVDTYRSLCNFVLERNGIDPQDAQYDIPAPRMLQTEVGATAGALMDAGDTGYLTQEQVSRNLLELLGSDDLHTDLKAVADEADARAAQAPAVVALQAMPEEEEAADADVE